VCSSAGRAAISKVAGRGFESLRTRFKNKGVIVASSQTKGLFMNAKVKERDVAEQKKPMGAHYFQDLKDEFKKISWTTKEELKSCTKITVGTTFIFGIGIYLVDLLIKGVLVTFGSLFHLIFG
jgi:preprotein translocase subunit SecE